MWRIYSYIDANGVQKYGYVSQDQATGFQKALTDSGASDIKLVGAENSEINIRESGKPWASAMHADQILKLGEADPVGNPEDFFADFVGGGSTLRNFLEGRGIGKTGAMAQSIQELLLPGAEASLGFGQGLAPSVAGENFNLSNLLSAGGLRGLAENSRNVFNQMAASGGGAIGQDTMQRPDSYGSVHAGQGRNLTLAALMERSPYFAAMFGRNAIDEASQDFFDQNRKSQAGGSNYRQPDAPIAPGNQFEHLKQQLGAGLFNRPA